MGCLLTINHISISFVLTNSTKQINKITTCRGHPKLQVNQELAKIRHIELWLTDSNKDKAILPILSHQKLLVKSCQF